MSNNSNLINGQYSNTIDDGLDQSDSFKLSTRAIHCGQSPSQWTHRSLIPPIINATTFELDVRQLFDDNFKGNVCDL